MVARYLRTNREFQTSQFGLAHRLSTVLRGRNNSRVIDGQRINSLAINGVSHVASLVGLKNIDVTSSVNDIIGSLERAYTVLEGGYDRVSESAISLSERLFPGTERLLRNLSSYSRSASRFGMAGAQSGRATGSMMLALTAGIGAAFAYASIFALPILTLPGVVWGVGTFAGAFTLLDLFSNPTRKYILKQSLYPLALTIGAAGLRFWMRYEHVDNWYCSAAMLATIFVGNLIPNLWKNLFEPLRHYQLNKYHKQDIVEMNAARQASEKAFQAKWGGDADAAKICAEKQREFGDATRKVPQYRYPIFWLNAIYETSRTYSTLLYLPLIGLMFSKGYDAFVALLYMSFWMAQLIYAPGGKAMFRHLGVGDLTEPHRYGDLPTKDDKLHGEPDTARIPETKLLNFSNRGLFREGRLPPFLIHDIVNTILTGYRVKVVINNDSHNLFYPETAGQVARANLLGARLFLIHKALVDRMPGFKELDYDKKLILLRIFCKENPWDPTQEFDHAMNAAVKGSWPNEFPNQVLVNQGDEAGDKVCGRALEKLLRANRKLASGVGTAAGIVKSFSTKETRFSLYNIFDNEYVELACAELAERVYGWGWQTDKRAKLQKALVEAITKDREKYLIEEYYGLMKKYGRRWRIHDARLRFIAQELVARIQREIKISELCPLADGLIAGLGLDQTELDSLIDGIAQVIGRDRIEVERLINTIRQEEIAKYSMYLAEMPHVPENIWAQLRDNVILALAKDAPPRVEEGNLLAFYENLARTGNLETDGQRAFWQLILDTVNRTKGGQATAKDVHEWIVTMRGSVSAPRETMAMRVAQEMESRFRMYRIVFSGKNRLSFWALNLIRHYVPWTVGLVPIVGKPLEWGLRWLISKVLSFPRGRSEKYTFWCQQVAREIMLRVAEKQQFSRDYSSQILPYSRETAEEVQHDKWVDENLEEIVNEVVDAQVRKARVKLKSAALAIMKHHIYDAAADEIDKTRNQYHALTTGITWILAHELEGIKHLASEARDNADSRLAKTLDQIVPATGTDYDINSFTLKGYSSLPFLNGGKSFLDQLPQTLIDLKQVKEDATDQLIAQVGDRDRAEALLGEMRSLLSAGIGAFSSTKGYTKNRWELCWEVPGVIFGDRDLQFNFWRMGLLRANKGTRHIRSRLKQYRADDKPGVRETISLMVAVESRIRGLRHELRKSIYATMNPDKVSRRPVEDYASEFYADWIVNQVLSDKAADRTAIGNNLALEGPMILRDAVLKEGGGWFSQEGKENFTSILRDARDAVARGEMGLLKLGIVGMR